MNTSTTGPIGSSVIVATKDRRLAALSHLGVPCYSIFLPLVIWATGGSKPFRRAHARQAFSFQVLFLAVYVVLIALMAVNRLQPSAVLAYLGCGFVLELPQVVRALMGRPPFRVLPFLLLAE